MTQPGFRDLLALAATGAADIVSVVVRQTLVQLETPDAMRGRVSAAWLRLFPTLAGRDRMLEAAEPRLQVKSTGCARPAGKVCYQNMSDAGDKPTRHYLPRHRRHDARAGS